MRQAIDVMRDGVARDAMRAACLAVFPPVNGAHKAVDAIESLALGPSVVR
jgi:hypothetical protein